MLSMNEDDRLRIQAVGAEAFQLGYRLKVEPAPNMPADQSFMAHAFVKINGPAFGRFLTYGPTAPETAEAGLKILRGIVERGEQWPEK